MESFSQEMTPARIENIKNQMRLVPSEKLKDLYGIGTRFRREGTRQDELRQMFEALGNQKALSDSDIDFMVDLILMLIREVLAERGAVFVEPSFPPSTPEESKSFLQKIKRFFKG